MTCYITMPHNWCVAHLMLTRMFYNGKLLPSKADVNTK